MNIIIEKRSEDWKAYLQDDEWVWVCGKNMDEAVGDLVRSHLYHFGIQSICNIYSKLDRSDWS